MLEQKCQSFLFDLLLRNSPHCQLGLLCAQCNLKNFHLHSTALTEYLQRSITQTLQYDTFPFGNLVHLSEMLQHALVSQHSLRSHQQLVKGHIIQCTSVGILV